MTAPKHTLIVRSKDSLATVTKFICEIFSRMGVTFRNESNESSSIIIGYNDATVTLPKHFLFLRSNNSLATVLQFIVVEVIL